LAALGLNIYLKVSSSVLRILSCSLYAGITSERYFPAGPNKDGNGTCKTSPVCFVLTEKMLELAKHATNGKNNNGHIYVLLTAETSSNLEVHFKVQSWRYWLMPTLQLRESSRHEYLWSRKACTAAQSLVVNLKLTFSNEDGSSIKGSVPMLLNAQHISIHKSSRKWVWWHGADQSSNVLIKWWNNAIKQCISISQTNQAWVLQLQHPDWMKRFVLCPAT
jgi:hypothetical protein